MNIRDCYADGLLKKESPSMEKANQCLELARRYIKKALDNLNAQNYDLVIFCCYTSMFHAARAVLFRDGIKERSHVCMVIYLKDKYPDISKYSNLLDAYRRSRHTALYSLDFLYKKEDVENAIQDSEDFLNAIEGLLR